MTSVDNPRIVERVNEAQRHLREMLDGWNSRYKYSISLKNATDTLIELTATFYTSSKRKPFPHTRVNVFFVVFTTQDPVVSSYVSKVFYQHDPNIPGDREGLQLST